MTDHSVMATPNSQTFIDEIRVRVQAGDSFIPLVGSGLSAPSGILMGQTFTNFLAYTMYLVLQDPAARTTNNRHRLNLRTEGWPKYPTRDDMQVVHEWCFKSFQAICKKHGFAVKPVTEWNQQRVGDVVPLDEVPLHSAIQSQVFLSLTCPMVPQLIRSSYLEDSESINRRLTELVKREHSNSLFRKHDQEHLTHSSQSFILDAGIRAMYDWRATLNFLSRIVIEDGQLRMVQPDQYVIDSFNTHITRDKQHNFGHQMLAHLARPMRFRTILTTNFDVLIEDAYSKLRLPLLPLTVSLNGSFPDVKTVLSQDSIIKMHGQHIETRADFSLNDEPTDRDKQNFAALFSNAFGLPPNKKKRMPVHLIVVGFSGADHRCIQMIKHTLDTNKATRIFWLCHSQWDLAQVKRLFTEPEYRDRIVTHESKRPDLLFFELYERLTLSLTSGGFAHEFTHRVPPDLTEEDTTLAQTMRSRLDSPLKPPEKDHAELARNAYKLNAGQHQRKIAARATARDTFSNTMAKEIVRNLLTSAPSTSNQLPEPLSNLARFGRINGLEKNGWEIAAATATANVMRTVLNHLSNQNFQCAWIELAEYADAHALAQEILHVISIRLGIFQRDYVALLPRTSDTYDQSPSILLHLKTLTEHFNLAPANWFFFFYGRNVPGSCSGWSNRPWHDFHYDEFHKFISILANAGFRILYAPYTTNRDFRAKSKQNSVKELVSTVNTEWHTQRNTYNLLRNLVWNNSLRKSIDNRASNGWTPVAPEEVYSYEDTIRYLVAEWLFDIPHLDRSPSIWEQPQEDDADARELYAKFKRDLQNQKLRFLYSLTLFRQAPHTTAFINDGVVSCRYKLNACGIDNDWFRSAEVEAWLSELQSRQILFRKAGGYHWMHQDLRLGLQSLLEAVRLPIQTRPTGVRPASADGVQEICFFLEMRAKSHLHIGEWYLRAFLTTGHSAPAFEAMHHFLQCAAYACVAKPASIRYRRGNGPAIVSYRKTLFFSAVKQLLKTASASKRWLCFWSAGPEIPAPFQLSEVNRLIDSLRTSWNNVGQPAPRNVAEAAERIKRLLLEESKDSGPFNAHQEHGDAVNSLLRQVHERLISLGYEIQSEGGFQPSDIENGSAIHYAADTVTDAVVRLDFRPIKLGAFHVNWEPDIPKTPREMSTVVNNYRILGNLLSDFHKETVAKGDCPSDQDRLHRDTSKWRTIWASKTIGDYKNATMMVRLIGEIAYAYVNRAKIEYHAAGRHNRLRWVQVATLCSRGLELCRELDPNELALPSEFRQRILLHSLNGLALSNLDRFWESNNQFNQATALLATSPVAFDEIGLAVVRLRRAEGYMTLASRYRDILEASAAFMKVLTRGANMRATPQYISVLMWATFNKYGIANWTAYGQRMSVNHHILHPLAFNILRDLSIHEFSRDANLSAAEWQSRFMQFTVEIEKLHVAAIDDACVMLDAAEKLLAGRSRSSLWWGRYILLRLRSYGDIWKGVQFIPLSFRRRVSHRTEIVSLFRRGILNSSGNEYRMLRLIKYFMSALDALASIEPTSESSLATAGNRSHIPIDETTNALMLDVMDVVIGGLLSQREQLGVQSKDWKQIFTIPKKQAQNNRNAAGRPEGEHLVFSFLGLVLKSLPKPIADSLRRKWADS